MCLHADSYMERLIARDTAIVAVVVLRGCRRESAKKKANNTYNVVRVIR